MATGQQTMSDQDVNLSIQNFSLAAILTTHAHGFHYIT